MKITFCCFRVSRFAYHLVNVCLHSTKNPLFRFIDFFLFVCFCLFCLHPPTDQPDNILLGPYRCGTGPRQMFIMNSNIFLILCMTLYVKYKAICKNSNDLPCSISPHSAIPAVPCPCPSVWHIRQEWSVWRWSSCSHFLTVAHIAWLVFKPWHAVHWS